MVNSLGVGRPAGATGQALLLQLIFLARYTAGVQVISDTPSAFAFVDPSLPKYVVALSKEGAALSDAVEDTEATIMTDRNGQKLACWLPNPSVEPTFSAKNALITQDDVERGEAKTPFESLEKLRPLCLYRQEGLWTYEVCYKKGVRQFRQPQENGGKKEEFSCGKYTGDDKQLTHVQEDASASAQYVKYISQRYEEGAKCTMTGAHRSTEVRFTCLPHTAQNVIVSVKEFPTCTYIITVSTPHLCSHPDFKPKPDNVHAIRCQALSGVATAGTGVGEKAHPRPAQATRTAAAAMAGAASGLPSVAAVGMGDAGTGLGVADGAVADGGNRNTDGEHVAKGDSSDSSNLTEQQLEHEVVMDNNGSSGDVHLLLKSNEDGDDQDEGGQGSGNDDAADAGSAGQRARRSHEEL